VSDIAASRATQNVLDPVLTKHSTPTATGADVARMPRFLRIAIPTMSPAADPIIPGFEKRPLNLAASEERSISTSYTISGKTKMLTRLKLHTVNQLHTTVPRNLSCTLGGCVSTYPMKNRITPEKEINWTKIIRSERFVRNKNSKYAKMTEYRPIMLNLRFIGTHSAMSKHRPWASALITYRSPTTVTSLRISAIARTMATIPIYAPPLLLADCLS
jgi:hypothetical protein